MQNSESFIPTDDYGYGTALREFLETFEQSARQSGRTTQMIKNARDGDIIVVHSGRYGRDVVDRLREEGIFGVEVVACNPRSYECGELRGRSTRRLIFDHCWTYLHYQWRLESLWRYPAELKAAHERPEAKKPESGIGWKVQYPSTFTTKIMKKDPPKAVIEEIATWP